MADNNTQSTLETTVNNLTNEREDGQDNKAPDTAAAATAAAAATPATEADTTTPTTPTTPATGTTDNDNTGTAYTPVFNDKVRTIIYIVCLIAGFIGAGFTAFGDPAVGSYISAGAGLLAAAFGVAYNPLRKN